jgi:hypothetical protein
LNNVDPDILYDLDPYLLLKQMNLGTPHSDIFDGIVPKKIRNFMCATIPIHSIFYKGINNSGCGSVKQNTDIDNKFTRQPTWFSTYKTASKYGNVFAYYLLRPITLFNLNNVNNILQLRKLAMQTSDWPGEVTREKFLATLAFATGYTESTEELTQIPTFYGVILRQTPPLQTLNRTSYIFIDNFLVRGIRFLIPSTDGYYGKRVKSSFHKNFHEEICIFSTFKVIERIRTIATDECSEFKQRIVECIRKAEFDKCEGIIMENIQNQEGGGKMNEFNSFDEPNSLNTQNSQNVQQNNNENYHHMLMDPVTQFDNKNNVQEDKNYYNETVNPFDRNITTLAQLLQYEKDFYCSV